MLRDGNFAIPQLKGPSASSSGSLGFIVCVQCCRIVDSVLTNKAYYLYPVANTVRPSVDVGEMITPA